MKVKASFFSGLFDQRGELAELEWSELVEVVTAYEMRAAKEGPLVSPAVFDGEGLKIANVVELAAWALLDFDDVPPEQLTAALDIASKFDAFAFTTWGQPTASAHQNEDGTPSPLMRARLAVRLSRTCSPAEWHAVWTRLVATFGADADESCKDPTRRYYTASLPLGAEWAKTVWRSDTGAAWDVDAALLEPVPGRPAPVASGAEGFQASDPIAREFVARLGASLSKRADPNVARMGTLIKAGLDGLSMAQPGQHDSTLFALACTLAQHFPYGDAKILSDHFRLSLGLMARESTHPDKPAATLENLADKIARAQKKIQLDAREAEDAGTVQRSRKIALAFHGKRAHPYTPEELAAFEEAGGAGPVSGPGADRWILQRGDNLYFFFDGTYEGPFSRSAIAHAAVQFLSPAISAGVELYEVDTKGNIMIKRLERLMLEYGTTLIGVEADMTATRAYLAKGRHVLVEAPCPVRDAESSEPLEPERDEELEEWLCLLAGREPGATTGGKVEELKDWLAVVTDLDRPAPALYLMGEAGAGKSLLAFGLARLWGQPPTTMRAALSSFNASITRSPLVFADEKIPETWHGEPRTEELRELITTTEFEVNRKYQHPIVAKGSLRIICCANNMRLISAHEDFTPEDARALADRFLFVRPHPEARAWLERRGGQAFTEELVKGDRIARHTLWLREQARSGARPVTRGGRLAVPGSADELTQAIQVSGGVRWAVLAWVHAFLCDPAVHIAARAGRPFMAICKPAGSVEGEADPVIWIAPSLVLECWDHYMAGDRHPSREKLTDALKGMLYPADVARRRLSGRSYQALKLEHLVSWCENAGQDLGELAELLERDTETMGTPGRVSPAN